MRTCRYKLLTTVYCYTLPSEINATLSLLLVHENDNAPLNEDAIKGVHKAQWLKAIEKEYASLKLNKVLSEPCDLLKGQIALGTKMVLKIKETENPDEPLKYKARLCGKGSPCSGSVSVSSTMSMLHIEIVSRCTTSLLLSSRSPALNSGFLTLPLAGDRAPILLAL